MKLINFALIACVASFAACTSEKKSDNASDGATSTDGKETAGYVVENVSYQDSINVGRSKAVASCSISYIKSAKAGDAVVKSTGNWIGQMLNDKNSREGVGEKLAKHVVDDMLAGSKDELGEWDSASTADYPPMAYEYSYDVAPLVLEPGYVTMMYKSYIYTGGAHGGAAAIGQTFDAASGAPVAYDMFKEGSRADVLRLVEKGLMEQYFKVDTQKEFYQGLLIDGQTLPLPANPPYFEKDGVCFLYQQYEIAPYSAGMPYCVIPYDTVKPYLTDAALKLLAQ